jgi:ribosomal protein L4
MGKVTKTKIEKALTGSEGLRLQGEGEARFDNERRAVVRGGTRVLGGYG